MPIKSVQIKTRMNFKSKGCDNLPFSYSLRSDAGDNRERKK